MMIQGCKAPICAKINWSQNLGQSFSSPCPTLNTSILRLRVMPLLSFVRDVSSLSKQRRSSFTCKAISWMQEAKTSVLAVVSTISKRQKLASKNLPQVCRVTKSHTFALLSYTKPSCQAILQCRLLQMHSGLLSAVRASIKLWLWHKGVVSAFQMLETKLMDHRTYI